MAIDLSFDSNEIPLLTDLYELTMAASYFALGFNRGACFDLSVRRLPPRRGFLVAAGLERLLEALEQFRFEPAMLDYLGSFPRRVPRFPRQTAIYRRGSRAGRRHNLFCRRANNRGPRPSNRGPTYRDAGYQSDWNSLPDREQGGTQRDRGARQAAR
jgi:hypothetical protein